MIDRTVKLIQHPEASAGFLGEGHLAVPLFDGMRFADTDPFILLMDDQLDLPGGVCVGGAHPHAGFETVTLVLEGDQQSQEKTLQTGGLEWLTAGSGIVHGEDISHAAKMRILQLWLVLPKAKRWTSPLWQELHETNVPVMKLGESEVRLYSGTSQGMTAPTINQTPTILVNFRVSAAQEIEQQLPLQYNGFFYVIEGDLAVGHDQTPVVKGQVAWLDRPGGTGESKVTFKGGSNGTRFIFYAGEPQRDEIVSHGPFIGDTSADISRLYQEYRAGKMMHVRDLPAEQVVRH